MTGMAKTAYDAIFILDQIPHSNVGGAPSYNATLLRAAEALGWKVLIVVTGRRLPAAIFSPGEIGKHATLAFSHAKSLGGSHFIASTPAAMLRALKRTVEKYRPSRPSAGKRVIIERYPDQSEIDQVRRILAGVEAPLIFVDTIFRDPYIDPASLPARPILIGHDIFHQRVASFEANGFTVTPRIDLAEERARVSRYGTVLAISDADAATYREMAPKASVHAVYPIVPKTSRQATIKAGSGRILYLGSAAHHNVDGLTWFLQEIWPRILERHPETKLDIVGSIGASLSAAPNTTIHGRVDDISAIAGQCAFAINPVRMGSGLKIKMVDYFNLGLGCITTSVGAHGFPMDDRPFVTADDAGDFAGTAIEWLSKSAICEEMSKRTQSYMRHFSLDAVVETLRLCR